MERTLLVEVVSPEANLYKGEATMVVATTTAGELGILPLHAPLVAELAPGELRLKHGDDLSNMDVFSVFGGYLSVAEDHLIVLADLAINMRDAQTDKLEANIESAKVRLGDLPKDADDDRAALDHEIEWLINCLTVAKRHQR